jgi:hypothetical protein
VLQHLFVQLPFTIDQAFYLSRIERAFEATCFMARLLSEGRLFEPSNKLAARSGN